jgi:hypothetical protein
VPAPFIIQKTSRTFSRQLAKFFFTVLQGLLGLLARGDVAEDTDGVPFAVQANRRQGQIDGDLAAVFSAGRQFNPGADCAAAAGG